MSPDCCLKVFFLLKTRKYHQENFRIEIISLEKQNKTRKQASKTETIVKYYFQKLFTTSILSVLESNVIWKNMGTEGCGFKSDTEEQGIKCEEVLEIT